MFMTIGHIMYVRVEVSGVGNSLGRGCIPDCSPLCMKPEFKATKLPQSCCSTLVVIASIRAHRSISSRNKTLVPKSEL